MSYENISIKNKEAHKETINEIVTRNENISTTNIFNISVPKILESFVLDLKKIVKSDFYLGEGFFGKVYYTRYNNQDVAMKVQQPNYYFFNEVHINQKINSKYIVKFHGASASEKYIMAFELMKGGTLKHLLTDQLNIKPSTTHKIIMQISKGMGYLHNCTPPIIHGDLSSSNILLLNKFNSNKKNYCKISDFGLGIIKNEKRFFNKIIGNVLYMAPEIYDGESPCDEKSDVFSFGILAIEILTLEYPPIQHNTYAQWEEFLIENKTLSSFSKCFDDWLALILSCIHRNPGNRPSFKEIIEKLKSLKKYYKDENNIPLSL
ncbi:hypothetical protein DICPUDRAFT_92958 [Dictyostelium purpureum]|uniref:Protein kinase domain-containing protein n=1 Tax=Dictyostelium purpureum TaxID=5786 RepID=F0ZZS2_DICPU|nr:uncharacterized protein DICPUDRAFT_92958 [Dictyostelium purpureum]EGC30555.1 hypothetical protein DICPUDRAFT_92958 [Dictyostelium purpureum]|eukprot:XP_003292922.1 hypothetical protein DICPUDRAFT_92958 [Dictyostelium purpureum]